jgi:hypothetical protein
MYKTMNASTSAVLSTALHGADGSDERVLSWPMNRTAKNTTMQELVFELGSALLAPHLKTLDEPLHHLTRKR